MGPYALTHQWRCHAAFMKRLHHSATKSARSVTLASPGDLLGGSKTVCDDGSKMSVDERTPLGGSVSLKNGQVSDQDIKHQILLGQQARGNVARGKWPGTGLGQPLEESTRAQPGGKWPGLRHGLTLGKNGDGQIHCHIHVANFKGYTFVVTSGIVIVQTFVQIDAHARLLGFLGVALVCGFCPTFILIMIGLGRFYILEA